MIFRQLILAILFTICFSSMVGAQEFINGRVLDASTSEGIKGVRVYCINYNKTVLTDSKGEFAFISLPKGHFQISFSLLGYETKVVDVNTLPDKQGALRIMLEPSPLEMEEVMVSGISQDVAQRSSYDIISLSKEELNASGAITLTDALAKVPGISQLSSGQGISKPVIRGMYGNRIITLYEGIRFDNQQWQDEHGLGLSSIGVDHVEIIRGPASLLYGSEAIGGVINIIGEKPAPVDSAVSDLTLRLNINSLGSYAEYGIKKAKENSNWHLRAGLESHADYLDGKDDRITNTRFNGGVLKAGKNWQRHKRLTSLNYTFSLYQFGFVTIDNKDRLPEDGRFSRSMQGPHHSVLFNIVSLQNTWFRPKSIIKLNTGLHINNRQEQEYGAKISLNMLLNSLNYDLQWKHAYSANSQLIFGSQGFAQANTNFGSRVIVPDAFLGETSLFAHWKSQLKKLDVEGGLRTDLRSIKTVETINFNYNDDIQPFVRKYVAANGSAGAIYHFTEAFLLKANVSTGYRTPNLAEISSNGLHEGTYRWEIGNPDMKKEQSLALDAGLFYEHKFIGIQASLYRNQILNYIYLQPTQEEVVGYQVYRYLQTHAVLQGGELSLDIKPPFLKWLDWNTTYSFIDARQAKGEYLTFIPPAKISNTLKAEAKAMGRLRKPFLQAGINYAFAQDHPGQFETATPGYLLVNAGIGARLGSGAKETVIAISGNNLLNEVYFDHLSRFKPLGIYNPGRNISLSIRYTF